MLADMVEVDVDPGSGELPDQNAGADDLAVDQHAIAVENNKLDGFCRHLPGNLHCLGARSKPPGMAHDRLEACPAGSNAPRVRQSVRGHDIVVIPEWRCARPKLNQSRFVFRRQAWKIREKVRDSAGIGNILEPDCSVISASCRKNSYSAKQVILAQLGLFFREQGGWLAE
jgi:hypothetical protein